MTQMAEFAAGSELTQRGLQVKYQQRFDTAATVHTAATKGRMRWFRDNIRQGSWFALLALTINLALSFGHFHALDGKVVSGGLISTIASAATSDDGSKPNHPPEGHVDVLCPICVASSAIAHALFATPPVVPVEFASVTLTHTFPIIVALVEPPPAAFRSRGPPLS